MNKLRIAKMERFCRFIALEDCNPSQAAYKAGYGESGKKKYKEGDKYFAVMGSKLMKRDDIRQRINTIREENAHNDAAFTSSLIDNLKKIIAFDCAKYMASSNCELPNGRTVTDYWLKTPIENWSKADRSLMLDGFDSSGRPKFISKQFAWEKLLKIYGLDGKDNSVDVEDILNLFSNAGLPTGLPINDPSNDLNSLNEYDDEQRRLEREADETLRNEEADLMLDNRTLDDYLEEEDDEMVTDEYYDADEDIPADDEYEDDEYVSDDEDEEEGDEYSVDEYED